MPHRHLYVLMPHQLLHGSQIHTGHDKMCRKGVPKVVETDMSPKLVRLWVLYALLCML
jgi:hypothetical protein